MQSIFKKSLLTVIGLSLSSSLYAFDDQRQGWFASLGAGIAQVSHEPYKSADSHTGFGTSQKIGYGINNQFIVHLSREDAWFKNDNDWHVSCVPGIGATYYFSEEANTLFVSATIGAGSFNNVDANKEHMGTGVALTLGYEMIKHLNAEFTFMGAHIKDGDEKINPGTFKAGVSYSWY